MTDIDRGRIGGEEDRLPWLEPVEDEQPEPGVAPGKLIAAVVVALLALGLIVGGLFWLRQPGTPAQVAGGDGDLITAPKGDYKVAPNEPGGMNVAGEGDATYAASQGTPVDAAIDISKQPEAPVAAGARTPPATKTASAEPVRTVPVPASTAVDTATPKPTAAKPAAPVTKPATPVSAPTPKPVAKPVEVAKKPEAAKPATGGGPAVQLGAFSTAAKAQSAWSDLSGRFPALRSLSHSVTLAEVGGKKLYRLRATGGSGTKASAVCRALTSAKEACTVVG
ncbi:SPOR domain-containing protein [Sphingomonas profundi]|uniref:SPOR domain-containing protein n=1 Tax=Alterirhizorhabdus profundi TaxID=2681549 RepID=UPI0012E8D7E6|nr:SPOR domain-containing protein [Sphingomonas profundi]